MRTDPYETTLLVTANKLTSETYTLRKIHMSESFLSLVGNFT